MRVCSSANEALKVVQEWKPDVIVSDIRMPEEDGYELMKNIRALKTKQAGKTPAVALTGYASVTDESKTLAAGYQAHPQNLYILLSWPQLLRGLQADSGTLPAAIPSCLRLCGSQLDAVKDRWTALYLLDFKPTTVASSELWLFLRIFLS